MRVRKSFTEDGAFKSDAVGELNKGHQNDLTTDF